MDELNSQLCVHQEATATAMRESDQAILSARTFEGQHQSTSRNADLRLEADARERLQLQETYTRAIVSVEYEARTAEREAGSDKEMLVLAQRKEAQARERTTQVETTAQAWVHQLSGALRSTEEGQAISVATLQQGLEEQYRQLETNLRQQLQSELQSNVAMFDQLLLQQTRPLQLQLEECLRQGSCRQGMSIPMLWLSIPYKWTTSAPNIKLMSIDSTMISMRHGVKCKRFDHQRPDEPSFPAPRPRRSIQVPPNARPPTSARPTEVSRR